MSDSSEVVKAVLFGESGVGKASIVSQFDYGIFDPNCERSKCAQFIVKTIDLPSINKSIKYGIHQE